MLETNKGEAKLNETRRLIEEKESLMGQILAEKASLENDISDYERKKLERSQRLQNLEQQLHELRRQHEGGDHQH
jgi:hypothetical protein